MGPYKSVARDIRLHVGLGGANDLLHREHIARAPADCTLSTDAYALELCVRQASLERETTHHITQVARMGTLTCNAIAYQWPAPFLTPSALLQHDPNSPLFAVAIKLGGIQITERLRDLQKLVKCLKVVATPKSKEPTPVTPVSRNVDLPRLALSFESGPVGARIIYDSDNGKSHRAVELRTTGLFLRGGTEFKHPPTAISRTVPAASSVQPLHWTASLVANLEPVLIRIRSQHDMITSESSNARDQDDRFIEDPPILSLGASEAIMTVSAVGQVDTRADGIGSIDKTTIAGDMSLATESLCVELWHPNSVDAGLQLLTIIPPKSTHEVIIAPSSTPIPSFPIGLSARVAIGRFVLFITAPDISPDGGKERAWRE